MAVVKQVQENQYVLTDKKSKSVREIISCSLSDENRELKSAVVH